MLRIVFIGWGLQIALPHQLLRSEGNPYDELFDVLMVRHARNGVAYGEDEIASTMFAFSRFPFDDATYPTHLHGC